MSFVIKDSLNCSKLRAKAYPDIGDQLDMVIKAFKELKEQGFNLGEEGEKLIALSDEVKAKYPKNVS